MDRLEIIPVPTHDSEGFWEAAAAAQLRFQRCSDCGTYRHPPSPVCASCRSFRHSWEQSAGKGELYSWTVVRHAVHPMFTDTPYIVAVVEIADCGQPRLVCNLDVSPATLRAGMAVQIWFERRGDVMIPQGRPSP